MIRILLIFLTLNLSAFAFYSGGKWPKTRSKQATGLAPKSFNYDESDPVTDVLIDGQVQQSFAYPNRQLTREETCTAEWADTKAFECHQRRRLKTTKGALVGPPSFIHFLDKNETKTLMTARDRRLFEFESEGVPGNGDLVYAYHGSQVIAIGMRDGAGKIQWTYAFGRGPLGVAFMKDLTHTGHDAFIFTDHLGTPFAYKQPQTNVVTYTPFNPWGELLASHPYPQPQYANQGAVPTWGFQLPTDPVFSFPPLGLSGHVYDHHSGLVYMQHRYYHPRLGHFLTPDFRAPDIYDPTTFTEPYAYAAGNPIMFMDPGGLKTTVDTLFDYAVDKKSDGGFFNSLKAHVALAAAVVVEGFAGEIGRVADHHTTGDAKVKGSDYAFATLEALPLVGKVGKVTKTSGAISKTKVFQKVAGKSVEVLGKLGNTKVGQGVLKTFKYLNETHVEDFAGRALPNGPVKFFLRNRVVGAEVAKVPTSKVIEGWNEFQRSTTGLFKSRREAATAWEVYKESSHTSKTLVVGKSKDTAAAELVGYQRINNPNRTLTVNNIWLQGAIVSNKPFKLVSTINKATLFNPKGSSYSTTVFYRELQQLKSANYTIRGGWAIPGK